MIPFNSVSVQDSDQEDRGRMRMLPKKGQNNEH